jgi:hypothetical protein
VALPPPRGVHRPSVLGVPPGRRGRRLQAMEPTGLRPLGDPRRAPALRFLQGDGPGGRGPGPSVWPGRDSFRQTSGDGGRFGRRSNSGWKPRESTRRRERLSSPSARRPWTPPIS